jgi:hypothetical protein
MEGIPTQSQTTANHIQPTRIHEGIILVDLAQKRTMTP